MNSLESGFDTADCSILPKMKILHLTKVYINTMIIVHKGSFLPGFFIMLSITRGPYSKSSIVRD